VFPSFGNVDDDDDDDDGDDEEEEEEEEGGHDLYCTVSYCTVFSNHVQLSTCYVFFT